MLPEVNCLNRRCKHFLGAIQPDGTELTEVWNCEAFPEGIPNEIAYGDNLHLEVFEGQMNSIIFEEGEIPLPPPPKWLK